MRILFLGDVVGRAGRHAVRAALPALRAQHAPDVVIVNGENAAAGFGITRKIAEEFFAASVDVITTGNHVFDQRELLSEIDALPNLLRPYNYPAGTPGAGLLAHRLPDGRVLVAVNLMARLFMEPQLDDPFAAMENILQEWRLGENAQGIFVDFHGETTAEKAAFAHHFDGRVSAVIGTHTHVPTADARVLKGGTAFQTDAGMCGDYDSVIGMQKDASIWRFVKKTPTERLTPAEGAGSVCGALVTLAPTGLAARIETVKFN